MITQRVDPHHYVRRARQIQALIPAILSQWGLVPRFKRWRLAQDPETGMVVLFGVLNNKYIATHTTTPFSNYFDPRLLHDLATGLNVQVIPSANDGLRYTFILERGEIDEVPKHMDPVSEDERLVVRVVYNKKPEAKKTGEPVDEQAPIAQGVGDFLKVFDDIKLRDDAARLKLDKKQTEAVLIEVEKPASDQ